MQRIHRTAATASEPPCPDQSMRGERNRGESVGRSSSLPHDKLVQVQQHAGYTGPGRAIAELITFLVEIGAKALSFAIGRLPSQCPLEKTGQRKRKVLVLLNLLRQSPGRFQEHGIVQQIQRLQWGVGPHPAAGRCRAFWVIKVGQKWVGRGALKMNVQTAAIPISACALLPVVPAVADFGYSL